MKFAIAVSSFNKEVTNGLLSGAKTYLSGKKAEFDVFEVPGAFELPLVAKKLASRKDYAGVICLGCVIKGDTIDRKSTRLNSSHT